MDVRAYYNGKARRYAEIRRGGVRVAATLHRLLLRNAGGGEALELGCGTGNLTAYLHRSFGRRLTALDISSGMVGEARRRLKDVLFVLGDARRLPFPSKHFFLVAGAYFLHHVPDWKLVTAEALRVLAPGGWLAIITSGYADIDRHFFGRFFPGFSKADRRRFPPVEQVSAAMRSAGFDRVRTLPVSMGRGRIDQGLVRKVRSRYLSTLSLLDDDEFDDGVTRLEAHVRAAKQPRIFRHRGTLIIGCRPPE